MRLLIVANLDKPNVPEALEKLRPWLAKRAQVIGVRNGPEGDYHTLTPLEFHANPRLLVQRLRKGHYNVKLDAEAWDRLATWIEPSDAIDNAVRVMVAEAIRLATVEIETRGW